MFKDALKAFLELKEQEAIISAEGGKKISKLAIGRFLYAITDYLIAGGLGTMVVWMNVQKYTTMEMYAATAIYDLLAAYFFFFASDLSGYDITLANSMRRAADVMFHNGFNGRILGGLLLVGNSIKAIIWEGPEVICFMFRKELNTRAKFHGAMWILSFGQGIFGTWLYTVGYEILKRFLPADVKFWQVIIMAIVIFIIFTLAILTVKKILQLLSAVFRIFWK